MKAKFVFYIEGDKEAIEIFYDRLSTMIPNVRNWEVTIDGELAIRVAAVVKGELIFTDFEDKLFISPTKPWLYTHKKTKTGVRTIYS